MHPKKSSNNGAIAADPHNGGANAQSTEDAGDINPPNESSTKEPISGGTSKKRKAPTPTDSNKALRRSTRGGQAPPAQINHESMLRYLLSDASLSLCRSQDERSAAESNNRTYSSSIFTPFEELVSAVILSRPISHALGLRSIRTIFNDPYSLTTPKKVLEAGWEGCREALDKARTQHRQKTAEELVLLAEAVNGGLGSGEEDVELEHVREEGGKDVERERQILKTSVKGFGATGLDIFGRRIQALWPEWFPFADRRTMDALEKLGLPGSAAEVLKALDESWERLDIQHVEGDDKDTRKRRVFVLVLERAVGADLEGNVDAVRRLIAA